MVLIVNGVIGEVQEYTSPQDVAQGLSERIYHTGNYDPDQVGDVFGVTMQMWNQCNPYILDVFQVTQLMILLKHIMILFLLVDQLQMQGMISQYVQVIQPGP